MKCDSHVHFQVAWACKSVPRRRLLKACLRIAGGESFETTVDQTLMRRLDAPRPLIRLGPTSVSGRASTFSQPVRALGRGPHRAAFVPYVRNRAGRSHRGMRLDRPFIGGANDVRSRRQRSGRVAGAAQRLCAGNRRRAHSVEQRLEARQRRCVAPRCF